MAERSVSQNEADSGSEQRPVYNKFKQYDSVSGTNDFKYHKFGNTDKVTNKETLKRIMKEWKILSRNLPESIFVRVYEERVDLMRAAIIGAQGTPYHHGLFFFDISFPNDYPNSPLKVRYHSFGLRLNPNLYWNGYVCLSLLNTWSVCQETEKWNPAESTILQVLVSIQGLVLNEKPYFNEPSIMKPAWSWKAYNEKVFALSCKKMLKVLEKQPKGFECLVEEHFQRHASTILRACIANEEGQVRMGFFDGGGDASSASSKGEIKVSSKFKKTMNQLYPQLFQAFRTIQAPLQDLPEKLEENREENGVLSKLKTFFCFYA